MRSGRTLRARTTWLRSVDVAGTAPIRGPRCSQWQPLTAIPDVSDLVPYWIYEIDGGARIERRVPLTPYTREVGQLARLKRGLALYRLVFGQPRQEDLLEYMSRVVPQERSDELVAQWRIDLTP